MRGKHDLSTQRILYVLVDEKPQNNFNLSDLSFYVRTNMPL